MSAARRSRACLCRGSRVKYYHSSFRVGDHGTKLVELVEGGSIAYVPNALDHIPRNEQKQAIARNETELRELGISVKLFDLRDYFSTASKLGEEIARFSGVWVSGGNTFVLRQAMKLSRFDEALDSLSPTSFLYGGSVALISFQGGTGQRASDTV